MLFRPIAGFDRSLKNSGRKGRKLRANPQIFRDFNETLENAIAISKANWTASS